MEIIDETLVLFTKDFDYREPNSRFTVAYRAGMCVTVDDACAEAAFAAGAAVPAEDDVLLAPTGDDVLTPIIHDEPEDQD